MKLYKYRDLIGPNRARVEQIICESKIWFATPVDFNDPFDCAIEPTFEGSVEEKRRYWGRSLVSQLGSAGYFPLEADFTIRTMRGEIEPYDIIFDRATRGEIDVSPEFLEHNLEKNMARDQNEAEQQKLTKSFQTRVNDLGVLSLAGVHDHILLWSHYAASHCGLCLEFDVEPGSIPFGSLLFSSARPVRYETDHPNVSLYERDEIAWRMALLFTKAEVWNYEREYRFIDLYGPGLKGFPVEQLTGVILGCAMSEADRNDVTKWVQGRQTPTTVYHARRTNRAFSLDIVTA